MNKWKEYWDERTKSKSDYFGKGGENANWIINDLDIKPKDSILDIGCGNGAHLSDMKKKFKNLQCFGLDVSDIAIKLNKDKKIKLKVGDMHSIPYKDKTFSALFSLGAVEHTPHTLQVLKEIHRVMKPRGKILLTVPNIISFFHLTKRFKMLVGKWEIGYEKSFLPYEFKKLLEKAGFKNVSYYLVPHPRVSNIFNLMDNKLNKLNNQVFGFFIHIIAEK